MFETPQEKLERLIIENIKQSSEIKNALINLNKRFDFVEAEIQTIVNNQLKINVNIQTLYKNNI